MIYRASIAAVAASVLLVGTAQAATVDISISGTDVPTFEITHDFTRAALEELSIELNSFAPGADNILGTADDLPFVFDLIIDVTPPAGGTLTTSSVEQQASFSSGPGNNDGNVSTDLLLEFSDFDAGETTSFRADIDEGDSIAGNTSFANVLINTGGSNAVITGLFSDGSTVGLTLPDLALVNGVYNVSANVNATIVPVPPALPLLGVSILAFGLLRRRAAA